MAEMPKADFSGDTPQREFWRDLKPIKQVFRPGALPEAYIQNAPTDDDRYYVPQPVFAYTISGKWGYLEHDWVATAGDWVYEAPGESHTLVAHEHSEPMKVTFNVTGPLIWLDENGEPDGTFDVFDYISICREHYDKVGIGSAYIDNLIR